MIPWWYIFLIHDVYAQEIVTNCSDVPLSGFVLNPYQQYIVSGIVPFSEYSTICSNPVPDDVLGVCSVPLTGNNLLLNATTPFDYGGPNAFTAYDYNCTQCTECTCPPSAIRGQVYGFCCGDAGGGVGCICPRTSANICTGSQGISAGECATTGFPTDPDYFTPIGQATAGVARANNWQTQSARTSMVGSPWAAIALNWWVGVAVIPSGLNCFAMKYQTAESGSECFQNFPNNNVVAMYNSEFGTLAIRNRITPSTYLITTLSNPFQNPTLNFLAAAVVDLDEIMDPDMVYRGLFLSGFDAGAGIFDTNELQIYYQLNTATAPNYVPNNLPVGTVVQATGTTPACAIAGPYGFIQFFPINTRPPNFVATEGTYLGDVESIFAITNEPHFLTPAMTANVTFWSFTGVGIFEQVGLCGGAGAGYPTGLVQLIQLSTFLPSQSTELDLCNAMLSPSGGKCNAPITFTYYPLWQAIQVNPNFNPSSVIPDLQPNLFLTTNVDGAIMGVESYTVYLAPPGSDGIPLRAQQGWTMVDVQGRSAQFNQVQLFLFIDYDDGAFCLTSYQSSCGIFYLSGDSGVCNVGIVVQATPVTPPPIQLANCDVCTNCVCTNFLAERGNGSLCCPTFRMGFECNIKAPTCSNSQVGVLCSGNGNSSYPGNINGTGCYFNTNTSQYTCSCLPEYMPPDCLFRFDDTCGNPLCNNRGTCVNPIVGLGSAGLVCQCNPGYRGPQCEFPIVQCFTAINALACSGHGTCSDPDEGDFGTPLCICDNGYSGAFCEQPILSTCLEVTTGEICADRGVCLSGRPCALPFPTVRPSRPCANCTFYMAPFLGFALVSAFGITGTSATQVVGNVAVNTTGANVNGIMLNGTIVRNTTLVALAMQQYRFITSLSCDITIDATTAQNGLTGTFTPGVYCFSGNPPVVYIRTDVILDAETDYTKRFVFIIPNAFTMTPSAQLSLTRGAKAVNVFFVCNGPILFQDSATFTGIAMGGTVTTDAEVSVDGTLVSLGGSQTLANSLVSASAVPTDELPCTAPATAFDLCNISNPTPAGVQFCSSKIGFGKLLLLTDTQYQQQTFPLAVIQCLVLNYTLQRGFGLMDLYENYCIIEQQATIAFFAGESTSQLNNVQSCPGDLTSGGSFIRTFTNFQLNAFIFNQACYPTSSIKSGSIPMPLQNAMAEAVVTRVRVGQSSQGTFESRDILLKACQRLAKALFAPYYGVSDSFSQCWLPGVVSAAPSNPVTAAMSQWPDYDYNLDIENANARLFYWALTSSIPPDI